MLVNCHTFLYISKVAYLYFVCVYTMHLYLHLRILHSTSTSPIHTKHKRKQRPGPSLKESRAPQTKVEQHQLLKINAVDIEGLGRSIN